MHESENTSSELLDNERPDVPADSPDEEDRYGRIGYGSFAKYSPMLLGLIIVAVVAIVGWREWQPEDDLPRTGQLLDQPAPAFELTLFDGTTVSNESLLGQAVALNFWGSWCAPCEAEMPAFNEVYTDLTASGRQATVIGVGIKNDYEENALDLIDRLGITYPAGRDTGGSDPQRGSIELAYGIAIYPSTVFIRPDGTVFAVRIGEMKSDEIMAYLEGAAEPVG